MSPADPNELLRAGWESQQRGDFRQAELSYRQALTIAPNHPPALNALASLAMQFNQPDYACTLFRQAVAGDPKNVSLHLNLGSALRALRRFDEALASAKTAVALQPDLPGPHTLLAAVLMDLRQLEEALPAAERAVAIDPEFPQALQALQAIYGSLLRPCDVMATADRLLALDPNDARAHWNKAVAALTAGDFQTGWSEFEWRTAAFAHLRRDFTQPPWNHQDLSGKTILLHCEGGFGDAIQFVRYVPQVKRRAKSVVLECPPPLMSLFASMLDAPPPLIARGQPLPPFDYHCPLQSLPFNFDTRLETILASVPYLRADPAKVAAFAHRIGTEKFRVGLVWAGSANPNDIRSRMLATFDRVLQVPGVRFFSLQFGPDASQTRPPVHDLSGDLHDFSDLAAAMENLDLVVSVDTAPAHLAGGLGKPVWTLIPFVPDFRWMLDRADTPWYPTMRLYRQTNRVDWNEPIARMARDLENVA